MIACFDSDVSEETIKAIAKQKPYYFVMRDSSMASDSVATNFDQISPPTAPIPSGRYCDMTDKKRTFPFIALPPSI